MRWQGTCYRAHDPKWAWSPLSGEEARLKGGRFNEVGTPALYLALTLEGMFLEMSHGLGRRIEPLTVCSYTVDVDDLVDLRKDLARAEANVSVAEMACAWAYERATGRTASSWMIAQRLMADGVVGILVPSFARGARPGMDNLVLWTWGADLPHRIAVHDPSGRLPQDQPSWR